MTTTPIQIECHILNQSWKEFKTQNLYFIEQECAADLDPVTWGFIHG